MTHPTRRALFALLAAAAFAAAPRPARAFEPSPYGINAHAPQGVEVTRLFDQVAAAGIGWVRIDFVWASVQPSEGTWDWQVYDRLAEEAAARDLELYATLAYSPDWATSGPLLSGVPDDAADWREFCRRAARRYRGRIDHWGLWNEPNLPRFWAGSRRQYLDRVLFPGIDGVRAGNPDARVGGPDLAHLTAGDADWYDWLRAVLLEAGDELDFVTHHVYDQDGPGDVTAKLDGNTLFGSRPQFWDTVAPSVREVLESAGAEDLPFWLTETGWASDQVGEGKQASHYTGFLDRWLTGKPDRSWIAKVFFYELQDDPTPSIPKWGLLRAGGSAAKPAFAAYRDFIAAHPPGPPLAERQLLLAGGRFAVTVRFRDHQGHDGFGRAVRDTDGSGFFWFFDAANFELVVKVLDARGLNGRWWVFYGALSDVEYWLDVTDTATGAVRRYHNPPGTLCGRADTLAFPDLPSPLAAPLSFAPDAAPQPLGAATAASCAAGPGTLCLLGARLEVEVAYRDPRDGVVRPAAAVPRSDQTGTFWFFAPENVELVVKALDGRPLTGAFWLFWGALSDLEYRIELTDTATGARETYVNPRGSYCGGADTRALADP
ncbi:MAG TPA: cellulase family glycosylhydrolase [Thermoanaerobaculia bacterium]|nr:cellulase family glycosylhydrolase [Thermoanaerobaculia bacterium]